MAILLAVLAGRHDARPVSPTAVAPRMAPARCRRFSSRTLAASSRAATSMSRVVVVVAGGSRPRRSSPAAAFAALPGPSTAAARDRSARSRLPGLTTAPDDGGFEPATTECGAGCCRRLDDSASLADVGESESEVW